MMWVCGAQLVALNYQTDGIPMQVNQALFRPNNATGYILKPPFLRTHLPVFIPHVLPTLPIKGSSGPTHLSITVISAQGVPTNVRWLFLVVVGHRCVDRDDVFLIGRPLHHLL